MPTEKPKIKMQVNRANGNTFFEFEVPQVLTDIFKEKSVEIKESTNWPGLKFYSVPDILEDETYKELLVQHGLFDNFGSSIIGDSGRFNIAFLRTAQGRGKIKLNRDLPFARVAEQVKSITRFLKAYYEEYLTDYKISGSVTIEM